MSDMQVRDVMVPRPDGLRASGRPDRHDRQFAIDTAHCASPRSATARTTSSASCSPRPARYFAGREFDLRDMLRPAVFVPESKRSQRAAARVPRVAQPHGDRRRRVRRRGGLVTIEDVLEQIVGDIEDEYDFDEVGDNIRPTTVGRYRVKATTEIEDFNEAFATHFSDEEYGDNVGGLRSAILAACPSVARRWSSKA